MEYNKAFGVDFETIIGKRDFNVINCHCLHLGEAAQKNVMEQRDFMGFMEKMVKQCRKPTGWFGRFVGMGMNRGMAGSGAGA